MRTYVRKRVYVFVLIYIYIYIYIYINTVSVRIICSASDNKEQSCNTFNFHEIPWVFS